MLTRKGISLLVAMALLFGAFACFRPASARADTEYIVILDPGEGTGSPKVYNSAIQGIKPSAASAGSYNFYYHGGEVMFKLNFHWEYSDWQAPEGQFFAGRLRDSRGNEHSTNDSVPCDPGSNTVTAVYVPSASYSLSTESFSLTPDDFDNEGYTALSITAESLVLGGIPGYNTAAEGLFVIPQQGTLSIGGSTLSYQVYGSDHWGDGEDVMLLFSEPSAKSFALFLDPGELAAAQPGTYTGDLACRIMWNIGESHEVDPVTIPITLTVAEPPYTLAMPEIVTVAPGAEYTAVTAGVTRLSLETDPYGNTPTFLRLIFNGLTLTTQDASQTITCSLRKNASDTSSSQKMFNVYSPADCGFEIVIPQTAWDAADFGTYTGSIQYIVRWRYSDNTWSGDIETGTIPVTLTYEEPPAFGTPDFTLPAAIQAIEANAFEGIAATVVDIPDGCTSIGNYAFANCPNLTQIRIPVSVITIGTDIFNGCTNTVYVFGTAGSAAETYCQNPANNCVFVAE